MADIAVRKENENRSAGLAPTWERWEPFRMMRDLLDPFREMAPYMPHPGTGFVPTFEIKETKDGYVFKADVPGVRESDLEITLTGNRLSIGGKREAERRDQSDTYYAHERSYGEFLRVFTLPDGVDPNGVQAELKDGVLTVTIKKAPELQPRKVPIQSAAKRS